MTVGVALLLVGLLACSRINISREQWLAMPPPEKTLYVRTLLGHEQSQAAKGGNDRVFAESPADYVRRIDAAYARGDRRSVDTIFEDLGVRR